MYRLNRLDESSEIELSQLDSPEVAAALRLLGMVEESLIKNSKYDHVLITEDGWSVLEQDPFLMAEFIEAMGDCDVAVVEDKRSGFELAAKLGLMGASVCFVSDVNPRHQKNPNVSH